MSLRAVAVFSEINSENLVAFKEIAKEMLCEIQKVDFITGYDMFFNADETRCVVLEEYSDASGVIEHVKRHSHFLEKLTALGGEIHGQMFPIDIEDENLRNIRESWNSVMHQHFAGKKNPGSFERQGFSLTK
jgi:quinol monooxygenase YgiN